MVTKIVFKSVPLQMLAAFALVAGSLFGGCGPAVQNISVKSPAAVAAVPDQATIVIVQPTTMFSPLNILDARGGLLGQLDARSHTVVHVPAGPVRLYAVLEKAAKTADRIDGTVEAGRIYYASVSMRWGGVSFLALNTRSPDARWSKKDQYLSRTARVQMDPQRVALARSELGDPAPVLEKADAFVAKLDAAHRAERTIHAEDGI